MEDIQAIDIMNYPGAKHGLSGRAVNLHRYGLMDRFFDSSPRRLALSLFENENLDETDVAELRRLLDDAGEE